MEHPPVQSAGVFESLVSVFFSILVDSCVLGIQFSPHLTSRRPHVEGREDDSLEPKWKVKKVLQRRHRPLVL